MKLTVLVENKSSGPLKAKHGLSLYIETGTHKILFDLGPDDTLFENARLCAIDLAHVDIVVISHGHRDHGGALGRFLEVNKKAKVYVQKSAFEPHYSKVAFVKVPIGLDRQWMYHPQVVLCDGDYEIDASLKLFTVTQMGHRYSSANDTLYDDAGRDVFAHEQNLIILGDKNVLMMGCGHTGVVSIMERAQKYAPVVCAGGFHLYNPATRKTVGKAQLEAIAKALEPYSHVQFYTCHCTGIKAFETLSQQMSNLTYLSCGHIVELS